MDPWTADGSVSSSTSMSTTKTDAIFRSLRVGAKFDKKKLPELAIFQVLCVFYFVIFFEKKRIINNRNNKKLPVILYLLLTTWLISHLSRKMLPLQQQHQINILMMSLHRKQIPWAKTVILRNRESDQNQQTQLHQTRKMEKRNLNGKLLRCFNWLLIFLLELTLSILGRWLWRGRSERRKCPRWWKARGNTF